MQPISRILFLLIICYFIILFHNFKLFNLRPHLICYHTCRCKRYENQVSDSFLLSLFEGCGFFRSVHSYVHSFQGMETMIVRYNSIVTSVKKKGYDLLDHRKGEVWMDRSVTTCQMFGLCLSHLNRSQSSGSCVEPHIRRVSL